MYSVQFSVNVYHMISSQILQPFKYEMGPVTRTSTVGQSAMQRNISVMKTQLIST
jgi:hypothetical protein